jgi:acyl carrier protein
MTGYVLKKNEIEDISELLMKVEKSFDIRFGKTELKHIATFGELCDHIVDKIQLDHFEDCTTQQAFYKLRNVISMKFGVNKKTISTDFQLIDLLPRQNRRLMIIDLERHLGFKLNILRPPHWVMVTFFVLLLLSLIGLFFNWQTGLLGLVFSIGGFWVANKYGNNLEVCTIGEVAKKMVRENYLKSRRNPKTFNKNEIEKILTDWFSDELGLDKNKLTRDAKFT